MKNSGAGEYSSHNLDKLLAKDKTAFMPKILGLVPHQEMKP